MHLNDVYPLEDLKRNKKHKITRLVRMMYCLRKSQIMKRVFQRHLHIISF